MRSNNQANGIKLVFLDYTTNISWQLMIFILHFEELFDPAIQNDKVKILIFIVTFWVANKKLFQRSVLCVIDFEKICMNMIQMSNTCQKFLDKYISTKVEYECRTQRRSHLRIDICITSCNNIKSFNPTNLLIKSSQ